MSYTLYNCINTVLHHRIDTVKYQDYAGGGYFCMICRQSLKHWFHPCVISQPVRLPTLYRYMIASETVCHCILSGFATYRVARYRRIHIHPVSHSNLVHCTDPLSYIPYQYDSFCTVPTQYLLSCVTPKVEGIFDTITKKWFT